jgi:hypothetical protein
MRPLLALALLVAIGAGALYFRYGTVAPCGILRERQREQTAAQRGLSAALASALPDQAVDALLAAQYGPLTPQRCVAVLVGVDGGNR